MFMVEFLDQPLLSSPAKSIRAFTPVFAGYATQ